MLKGAPDGTETGSVKYLAGCLELANNGVTERVQRAEEAGLVKRTKSKTDRRSTIISLTPEGQRRFTAVFAALGDESDRLRAHVVADAVRLYEPTAHASGS